ncbi:hypothetical protein BLOT_009718 [Blomia tropicalis]|nr:hypothetical protein BLOT_009718 [Blomia tropicalis]
MNLDHHSVDYRRVFLVIHSYNRRELSVPNSINTNVKGEFKCDNDTMTKRSEHKGQQWAISCEVICRRHDTIR